MSKVLSVNGVHAGYNRRAAIVHGVDLEVAPGRTVALLGPNGSGKSTLLKTVFGLTSLHRGSICFGGDEITGIAPYRLPSLGMSYVPQQDAVFAGLSVKENLSVGSLERGRATVERVNDVLDLLPRLGKRLRTDAGALSGGEQRMVGVGRALMSKPSLLLLDEPTAGLAPKAGAEILEQIDELRAQLGLGVLLVEQNARSAVEIADSVMVLAAGEIAFSGTRDEAVADSELAELYLGRAR